MRNETKEYLRCFGIDERIRNNIATLRETLLLARLCSTDLFDEESDGQADFVLRALDLIESKQEEMLEIYARNFESMFSATETRAILKYAENMDTLERGLMNEMRALFRPLLRAYRLEDKEGPKVVEVRSKAELDRELSAALDETVAFFGRHKRVADA